MDTIVERAEPQPIHWPAVDVFIHSHSHHAAFLSAASGTSDGPLKSKCNRRVHAVTIWEETGVRASRQLLGPVHPLLTLTTNDPGWTRRMHT